MSDAKIALLKKIQAVSMDVMNLSKDMEVGSGYSAYKAVSDNQVTLAVKRAEEKHGIISIPLDVELINSEVLKKLNKDNKEILTYVENVKMTLEIFDVETGYSIKVTSLGKGLDSGDKGFGKASTYARKYALLNAYKIATGEDPDANKSPEEAAPPTVSEKRKIVLDWLALDAKTSSATCSYYGAESTDDLSDKNIEEIYKSAKMKKLI